MQTLLKYEPETGKLFWKERMIPDFDAQYAGEEAFTSCCDQGYKQGEVLGINYRAHRVIWYIIHGYWPEQVDHINGIKTDNRLINLREVTCLENGKNQKRSSRNKSGVTGVRFTGRKWEAGIQSEGKRISLGSYVLFEDAVKARKEAEIKYEFHKNHGRG